MDAWAQVVKNYAAALPEPIKKAGAMPDTHKRCSMCKKIKPRAEFYRRGRDYESNSVSPKCKPCHIAYANKRDKEMRAKRRKA